jgi:hypothetical protein
MNEPATKEDLEKLEHRIEHKIENLELAIKNFVLDRETALVWRVITLQLTVVGGIAAAQFGLIYFILTHWKQ